MRRFLEASGCVGVIVISVVVVVVVVVVVTFLSLAACDTFINSTGNPLTESFLIGDFSWTDLRGQKKPLLPPPTPPLPLPPPVPLTKLAAECLLGSHWKPSTRPLIVPIASALPSEAS